MIGSFDNSYFTAELLGKGKGLLAFVMFGASKHHTRLIYLGGVYTAQMQCEFFGQTQTDSDRDA